MSKRRSMLPEKANAFPVLLISSLLILSRTYTPTILKFLDISLTASNEYWGHIPLFNRTCWKGCNSSQLQLYSTLARKQYTTKTKTQEKICQYSYIKNAATKEKLDTGRIFWWNLNDDSGAKLVQSIISKICLFT